MSYTLEYVGDYYAYGRALREYRAGIAEKYLFTGKERDAETGWDFFGARTRDAEIIPFGQRDKKAQEYPAWSPYNYALCNPVNVFDPDGNAPFLIMESSGGPPPDWLRRAAINMRNLVARVTNPDRKYQWRTDAPPKLDFNKIEKTPPIADENNKDKAKTQKEIAGENRDENKDNNDLKKINDGTNDNKEKGKDNERQKTHWLDDMHKEGKTIGKDDNGNIIIVPHDKEKRPYKNKGNTILEDEKKEDKK